MNIRNPHFKIPNELTLLGIVLLAFGLRLWGVSFGLPYLYHADEPIVVNHALAYGAGDLNPHFFRIPPLVSYSLFFFYGIYFLIGRAVGTFASAENFEILFYSDPTSFYLIARVLFGVILGTATVYLFYRLIQKHFSRQAAVVSSFFLAVCFLHVRDSHYVYADIPLLLVMTGAFFFFFRMIQEGNSLRTHLCAGALIGLAAAVKYNGAVLIFPYFYASLSASEKVPEKKGDRQRTLAASWIAAGFSAIVVFVLLNPYAVLDFSFFWQELTAERSAHEGGVGIFHHIQHSLLNGVELPLLITFFLGLFIHGSLARTPRRACFAVFLLSYYAILCIWGQPYARYVLPLIPPVLFFSADFVLWCFGRFKIQNLFAQTAFVVLLASPTFLQSVSFDRLMSAEDTRTQAKEWIEENIPSGSRVILDQEYYSPRLNFSQKQLREKKERASESPFFSEAKMRKIDFALDKVAEGAPSYELYGFGEKPEDKQEKFLFAMPVLPFDLKALKTNRIDYVVTVISRETDLNQSFYDELDLNAELIAEFNPYKDFQRKWPYDHPLTGGPTLFKDVMARARNGQILKVYKL